MSALPPRELRDAFGRFMTGVTVVTARNEAGQPAGFTANSFTSVSLDPPLLLVCPGKHLSSFGIFETCAHFAVSVLAEDQKEISNTFAGTSGDRFAQVPHAPDAHGTPVIDGAVARFSCRTFRRIDAGDHMILLGEVTGFDTADKRALGYERGQYFSLGLERAVGISHGLAQVCGALIQSRGDVILETTPHGYRPPQIALPARRDLAPALAKALAKRGVPARIGPVYSVFDDAKAGQHHAYLLAYPTGAITLPAESGLRAVPLSELAGLSYASPAIATMMMRFAHEAHTRDFTLYLGDAEAGDTHRLSPPQTE
jgi:flavin reductase (DIM6/NTAB) family NADH-FMN oxidoreductase RutF